MQGQHVEKSRKKTEAFNSMSCQKPTSKSQSSTKSVTVSTSHIKGNYYTYDLDGEGSVMHS